MKKRTLVLISVIGVVAVAAAARRWFSGNEPFVAGTVGPWADAVSDSAARAAALARDEADALKASTADVAQHAAERLGDAAQDVAEVVTSTTAAAIDATADSTAAAAVAVQSTAKKARRKVTPLE